MELTVGYSGGMPFEDSIVPAAVPTPVEPVVSPVVFTPYLMPKVCVNSLEVVGHEILMRPDGHATEAYYRWLDRLPLSTRLVTEIGLLEQVAGLLPRLGLGAVSINASRALLSSHDGLRLVLALVGASAGTRVTIEILESEVPQIAALSIAVESLAEAGARIALDDFGRAQSGLMLFNSLPVVHELKLDQSIMHGARAARMVPMLVEMAARGGAVVTAEHIDSQAMLDFARGAGVHFAQGFHVGKPQAVLGAAN